MVNELNCTIIALYL